jgi:hypothetical protein
MMGSVPCMVAKRRASIKEKLPISGIMILSIENYSGLKREFPGRH